MPATCCVCSSAGWIAGGRASSGRNVRGTPGTTSAADDAHGEKRRVRPDRQADCLRHRRWPTTGFRWRRPCRCRTLCRRVPTSTTAVHPSIELTSSSSHTRALDWGWSITLVSSRPRLRTRRRSRVANPSHGGRRHGVPARGGGPEHPMPANAGGSGESTTRRLVHTGSGDWAAPVGRVVVADRNVYRAGRTGL